MVARQAETTVASVAKEIRGGARPRARARLPFWLRSPVLYTYLAAIKVRLVVKGLFSPQRSYDIPRESDFGNRAKDASSTTYPAPEGSPPGLQEVIRERGFDRIVLRGAGHAQNGSTIARSPGQAKIFLLEQNQESPRFEVETHASGTFVTTSARVRWLQLENFLNVRGLCAPVLTDVLDTSIGGTLSVGGGYGARSIRQGAQFSQVERIRFLNSQGVEELIDVATGGAVERRLIGRLGRDGILLDVTMRVIPLRARLVRYSCLYRSLSEQLAHLGRLLSDPWFSQNIDRCALKFRPFRAQVCHTALGFEFDPASDNRETCALIEEALTPHAYKRRVLDTREHTLTQMHQAHSLVRSMPPFRVWCDFAFPSLESYEAFLHYAYRSHRFDVSFGLPVRADVAHTQKFGSTPIFHEHGPGGRFFFGVGIYRFFSDRASAEWAVEEVGKIYRVARSLDGRPYLYGAFPQWVIEEHLERTIAVPTNP